MRFDFCHWDLILDGGNSVYLRFHWIWVRLFLGPMIWLAILMVCHVSYQNSTLWSDFTADQSIAFNPSQWGTAPRIGRTCMHCTPSDPAHCNKVALNHEMKASDGRCPRMFQLSKVKFTARASWLIARLHPRKRHRRMQAHPKSGMHYAWPFIFIKEMSHAPVHRWTYSDY